MAWTPIVGRAFTKDEFSAYVKGINIPQWPQFVALHNTDAPDLKTYAGYQTRKPPVTDQQWLKNLEHNYRDLQHWSAGPHLFIVPKERGILAFTPLTARDPLSLVECDCVGHRNGRQLHARSIRLW
jgi:hypothetical protein